MNGESPAAAPNDQPQSQQLPSVSLPKGGGAIRGIGEKFGSNPVTGTGSMTVPIATSPGRAGFGPELSLSYDSGAGNGAFGFGWQLSLPAITRSTDDGLPQYRDEDDSDVFVLSGSEDLVPALVEQQGGLWKRDRRARTVAGVAYRIDGYRPRVEGLFARIERWTRADSGEVHWRSISRDNVTTLYGKTPESRIADPADSQRVFSWLICETYDDKGNAIVYEYAAEDSTGVDPAALHEATRTPSGRTANRYPKRIRYGNAVSRLVAPDLSTARWYFEVVFDYLSEPHGGGERGEHFVELAPDADGRVLVEGPAAAPRPWGVRADPFSVYRPGFEVRTYRLCRRVLMLHHFPDELGVENYVVRSTEFTYDEGPTASFVTSATQSGYVRRPEGRFLKRSLPPVEFGYSEAAIDTTVREVEPATVETLPAGLAGADSRWIDLDGEGIAGVLTEHETSWLYRRNESPLNIVRRDGAERAEARFAPVELVASKPAPRLGSGDAQFLDLAGDGQTDLVTLVPPLAGFYERVPDPGWSSFRSFASPPAFDPRDPNLRFVDLDGDGHADALVTEDEALTWYRSLGEEGFETARHVPRALDELKGPALVFADGTESIHLADLSGDGQPDIVRIRNGEVCYWPNLGYGRFGAKVAMDGAPHFDEPDHFQPRRVRLADIDGSGVTDIIYVGGDGVDLYFNKAGNGWSAPSRLGSFPGIDDAAAVDAMDLLGNGTASLVWSSPLPDAARQPMRYVELMGEGKPHLLVSVKNNLGAETRVRYASSTRFYLQDKRDGRPWLTRLPFPVHVVERLETYDHVSRNRFVSRYAYHHGYFDGAEREFRGFGLVEQFDTEEFAALSASGEFPVGDNVDAASHVPPVLTRTWFHTGAFLESERVSRLYTNEYYRPPGLTDAAFQALLLPDTTLPAGLDATDAREACRALKGSLLREEIYGLDGTPKAVHPYRVAETNYGVVRVQPRASNENAVFFVHRAERVEYHHERNPHDPRVTHDATLEVDAFGNVLAVAAVSYGRVTADAELVPQERAAQAQTWITFTQKAFTNVVDEPDGYRTPLPAETQTYELTGLALPAGRRRFTGADLRAAALGASEIDYGQTPGGSLQKRTIERTRTLYRKDDMTGPLALGRAESLALPYETHKLALTPGLVSTVFDGRATATVVESEGRYVTMPNAPGWWVPSGRFFYASVGIAEPAYAKEHFFLPRRYRDPFHTAATPGETSVRYDPYDVVVDETCDALGNLTTAGERASDPNDPLVLRGNDYRVLQPRLVSDPNGNRTELSFDALGFVAGTAVTGKPGEALGDSLAGFAPDLSDAQVAAHLADPVRDPHAILGRATTRIVNDVGAFMRAAGTDPPAPAVVYTLVRETHDADLGPGEKTRVQHAFAYTDGFGREIQKKLQAEPGPLSDGGPNVPGRWVGTGWTVLNNKGNAVRSYEPFFDESPAFRFAHAIGVSPIIFYDPLGRVVGTLHPDHTYEKVVFDCWRQESWDRNDNAVRADPRTDPDVGSYFGRLPAGAFLPTWHALRTDPGHATAAASRWPDATVRAAEADAAAKTALHAETETASHLDSLGRVFLAVVHNRLRGHDAAPVNAFLKTRTRLDVQGNVREVWDAKERLFLLHDYDLLAVRLRSASMDAGNRWSLSDVAGNEVRAWDGQGRAFRTEYDPLRRPLRTFVRGGDPAAPNREILESATEYGEGAPGDARLNLRTRVLHRRDGAGLVTTLGRNSATGVDEAYDFKGNALNTSRQLAAAYAGPVDWSAGPAMEAEVFRLSTAYDALNRPTALTSPDGSVVLPAYNEANLLESLAVQLRGAGAPTPFVRDVDYDAKGRRTLIEYANRAVTTYAYDRETSRLCETVTKRPGGAFPQDTPNAPSPPRGLENLTYAFDPMGNVTRILDRAQPRIFFRNRLVEATRDYTYDAAYRLVAAAGREHLGQAQPGAGPVPLNADDGPRTARIHPGDGNAMGRYRQQYVYDEVGNLLQLLHRRAAPATDAWTRSYEYQTPSLLEAGASGNRLTRTRLGTTVENYEYDPHGNVARMPHLPSARWGAHDRLAASARQVVAAPGVPETTYYVYDSAGERVRKVTERALTAAAARAGGRPTRLAERIYIGPFELFRRYEADGTTLALERESLHVTDDRKPIAIVETRTKGNDAAPPRAIRYRFADQVGSIRLELDEQARIVSYEEYYPFGSTSYQAVRARTETPRRFRHGGRERDEENALYFYGARYYAPWLGRWVSPDPQLEQASPYVYVRNNPGVRRELDGEISGLADFIGELEAANDQVIESAAAADTTLGAVGIGVLAGLGRIGTGALNVINTTANVATLVLVDTGLVTESDALQSTKELESSYESTKEIVTTVASDPASVALKIYDTAVSTTRAAISGDKKAIAQVIATVTEIAATAPAGGKSAATGLTKTVSLLEKGAKGGAELIEQSAKALKKGGGEALTAAKKVEFPGVMKSSKTLESVERAPKELVDKVASKRTVVIAQEGSEELRFLDHIGAEASAGGPTKTHIILRPNPGKAAVLEEFLHGTQERLGIIKKLGEYGFGSAETHVKNFMIRHQKLLGLSPEDVAILAKLRDMGL